MKFIEKYGLTINSVIVVVLTSILTTILHELGHFIPAYFFGLQPELHHNFVSYDNSNVSSDKLAIIAACGPVLSLVLGTIFLFISKNITAKGYLSLFTLWMGLQGFLTFFGYLFIAPFFTYGDTGKVFAILGFPFVLVIAISVFGIAALVYFFKKQTKEFRFYGDEELNIVQRANALILFPVLGSLAACFLQLPVPTFLSLLAPIMMPMSFMSIYGEFRKTIKEKPTISLNKISWLLLISLIAAIILFRLLNYPTEFGA